MDMPPLSTYTPVDGYLHYFYFRAIMYNASMSTHDMDICGHIFSFIFIDS